MDNTPALEGSNVSSVFAQNTNVLYSVCQAKQAGSSDRKALQHKIWIFSNDHHNSCWGNFKLDDSNK